MKKAFLFLIFVSIFLTGCSEKDESSSLAPTNISSQTTVAENKGSNSSSEDTSLTNSNSTSSNTDSVAEESEPSTTTSAAVTTTITEQSPVDMTVTTDEDTLVIQLPQEVKTLPVIVIHFISYEKTDTGYKFYYSIDDNNCNADFILTSVVVDNMDVTSVCDIKDFAVTKGSSTEGSFTIAYNKITPNSLMKFTGNWINNDTGTVEYLSFYYEASLELMTENN